MDRETLLEQMRMWADAVQLAGGELIEFVFDRPASPSEFKRLNNEFSGALTPLEGFFCEITRRINFTWFVDDDRDLAGCFNWCISKVEWINPEDYFWYRNLQDPESFVRRLELQRWDNGNVLVMLVDDELRGKFSHFDATIADFTPPVILGEDVNSFLQRWGELGFTILPHYEIYYDASSLQLSCKTPAAAELRGLLDLREEA